MPQKPSRKAILTHIFFFSLFLVVPILVSPTPPGERRFALTRAFIQDTIANGILLGIFYLNYYLLIPRLYYAHRRSQYILCIVICLALVIVLPEVLVGPFRGMVPDVPPNITSGPGGNSRPAHDRPPFFFLWSEFRHHLYLFITAIFFSLLLRIREHLDEVKKEKLEAEIALLKAQINPHFLFNILNNIYTLSIKKDDRVSDAIFHLSGIMRYAIQDNHAARIPLEQEIDYIRNYIWLQKSRIGGTASIVFECDGDPGQNEIAPLILITYIENAFKHGINPDVDNCVVEIKLQMTSSSIRLHTFNRKILFAPGIASSGMGMSNTLSRIKQLYPGKYNLHIDEDDATYSVTLLLELT
jgi:hypothetical protein